MQEKSLTPGTSKKENKGETINELAHRHLMDQHHTTTDEEIRNATMNPDDKNFDVPGEEMFEVDNATVIPALPGEEESATKNENDNDEDDNDVPNPYSVLGS